MACLSTWLETRCHRLGKLWTRRSWSYRLEDCTGSNFKLGVSSGFEGGTILGVDGVSGVILGMRANGG